jgi:hypothetical protein
MSEGPARCGSPIVGELVARPTENIQFPAETNSIPAERKLTTFESRLSALIFGVYKLVSVMVGKIYPYGIGDAF